MKKARDVNNLVLLTVCLMSHQPNDLLRQHVESLGRLDARTMKAEIKNIQDICVSKMSALDDLCLFLDAKDDDLKTGAILAFSLAVPLHSGVATEKIAEIAANAREKQHVRSIACSSLGVIGPKSLPMFEKLCSLDDSDLRRECAMALTTMASAHKDKRMSSLLLKLFLDPSPRVAAASREGLLRIGTPVIPELRKIAEKDRTRVTDAYSILYRIDPKDIGTVDWMKSKLRSGTSMEKQAALLMTSRHFGLDPAIVDNLMGLIESKAISEKDLTKNTADSQMVDQIIGMVVAEKEPDIQRRAAFALCWQELSPTQLAALSHIRVTDDPTLRALIRLAVQPTKR